MTITTMNQAELKNHFLSGEGQTISVVTSNDGRIVQGVEIKDFSTLPADKIDILLAINVKQDTAATGIFEYNDGETICRYALIADNVTLSDPSPSETFVN